MYALHIITVHAAKLLASVNLVHISVRLIIFTVMKQVLYLNFSNAQKRIVINYY